MFPSSQKYVIYHGMLFRHEQNIPWYVIHSYVAKILTSALSDTCMITIILATYCFRYLALEDKQIH